LHTCDPEARAAFWKPGPPPPMASDAKALALGLQLLLRSDCPTDHQPEVPVSRNIAPPSPGSEEHICMSQGWSDEDSCQGQTGILGFSSQPAGAMSLSDKDCEELIDSEPFAPALGGALAAGTGCGSLPSATAAASEGTPSVGQTSPWSPWPTRALAHNRPSFRAPAPRSPLAKPDWAAFGTELDMFADPGPKGVGTTLGRSEAKPVADEPVESLQCKGLDLCADLGPDSVGTNPPQPAPGSPQAKPIGAVLGLQSEGLNSNPLQRASGSPLGKFVGSASGDQGLDLCANRGSEGVGSNPSQPIQEKKSFLGLAPPPQAPPPQTIASKPLKTKQPAKKVKGGSEPAPGGASEETKHSEGATGSLPAKKVKGGSGPAPGGASEETKHSVGATGSPPAKQAPGGSGSAPGAASDETEQSEGAKSSLLRAARIEAQALQFPSGRVVAFQDQVKLRPSGCSKCRYQAGCAPSCWKQEPSHEAIHILF